MSLSACCKLTSAKLYIRPGTLRIRQPPIVAALNTRHQMVDAELAAALTMRAREHHSSGANLATAHDGKPAHPKDARRMAGRAREHGRCITSPVTPLSAAVSRSRAYAKAVVARAETTAHVRLGHFFKACAALAGSPAALHHGVGVARVDDASRTAKRTVEFHVGWAQAGLERQIPRAL